MRALVWGLLIFVSSGLGVAGYLGWQWGWWSRLLHFGDRRTVLVLPFEVRGQEEGSSELGRAFAESVAINLAGAKDLEVFQVPAGEEGRATGAMAREERARSTGAGRLLTGTLHRRGKVIDASLSLVDTADHRLVWSAQGRSEDNALTSLAASFAAGTLAHMKIPPAKLYDYPRNFAGSPRMAASGEFREALEAVRRSDHGVALEATRRLVEKFPSEADAHALRAYELFQARGGTAASPEELEAELAALEKLDPAHATAKNLRCEILLNDAGRFNAALACSTELLRRGDLTPAARAWPLRDRAAVKLQLHDAAGALKDLHDAASLDPTNHFTFAILGEVQKNMGDSGGAAASIRQSLALVPENAYAIRNLAEVLDSQGKSQEAEHLATRLCEGFPTPCHCAYQARLLLKSGRRSEALAAARKGSISAGNDPGEDYCLAGFWAVAGEEDEAIRSLKKALSALPAGQLADLDSDPDFQSLHGLTEFEGIVAQAKKQSVASRGSVR
ncbi:MAG TPA: hypothetical protein VGR38_05500 [Candidatus Polarisedimenticolia bacterium]|nr:hypothetical protein [Candidatus Polarisedimenticolia bacterium]